MTVKVRIPRLGVGDETVTLSVEEARKTVNSKFQEGYVAAINDEIVHDTQQIKDGQEVRLYPAIAGG